MGILQKIQPFVQSVAEAIAAALKLEVEIVDNNLLRVAGTGRLRLELGLRQKRGFVNRYVLKEGKPFIISDPGRHSLCEACELKGNCYYLAGLFSPIIADGDTIGLISLVSFTEEQRKALLADYEQLQSFVTKMAELLAAKAKQEAMFQNLMITSNNLRTIINSVQEGIVAVDAQGLITHFNPAAARVFRVSPDEVINRQVKAIFPRLLICQVIKKNRQLLEQVVTHKRGKTEIQLLSSAFPIRVNDQLVGAVESFRLVSDMQRVASRFALPDINTRFDEILGTSVQIKQLKDKAQKVAANDSTVLIEGESGTGKELFAQAIHTASPRASKPFVAINCSAIPDALLESELFGYEEGAFTGAKHGGKLGKFELAQGGTIFLDEIAEMPLYLQAKLLRVLQEKKIERVGGIKEVSLDIRVIAATNKNLDLMVTRGEFREDLYYRLNVIPLTLPPLRERTGDIPLLLDFFLKKFNFLMNKEYRGFTPEAMKLLLSYPWTGNIRELQNAVEYACNLETGELISLESLPYRIKRFQPGKMELDVLGVRLNEKIKEIERQILVEALESYKSNNKSNSTPSQVKEEIAKALGISRATIYRKLKEYGLECF